MAAVRKSKSVITIKDLAEICGVSRGTVDRALNNRGGINDETRSRILETARSLGYIKNQSAAALSAGKSPLIGVILFSLDNEFFATIVSSIEKNARKFGYSVLVMLSGYDRATEIECAERLVSLNVSKLIVCSVLSDAAFYRKLIARGISVAAIVNRIGGLPFIGIDDFAAMYESTRYVISNGYKKIYYIAPVLAKKATQNISAQTGRYDGFIKAAADLGFKNYSVIDNYADYASVFSSIRGEKCCAVICSSDSYTIDCMANLHDTEAGIMGFDRIKVLEKLYPTMSSVSCPTEQIGEQAVRYLATGVGTDERGDIILPFHLICGSTIKKQSD